MTQRVGLGRLDGSPMPTDEELLSACRRDRPDAFAELASRHAPYMQHLAERLLSGDHHTAQDVVQECLVKLHAATQRDDRPLKVRAWLSVVVRNACMDEHRRRLPLPVAEAPDVPVVDDDPFGSDPFLDQAWEALPERFRTVLHHRELLGLSYDEIGAAMGVSRSAVQTLLFRARGALRREYQRAGGELLGCGAFGLSLLALSDGETGRHDAQLIDHLASCGPCDGAWARLNQLSHLLRTGAALVHPEVATPRLPSLWGRCWTAAVQFYNSQAVSLNEFAHASAAASAVPLACVAALIIPHASVSTSPPRSPRGLLAVAHQPGAADPLVRLTPDPSTLTTSALAPHPPASSPAAWIRPTSWPSPSSGGGWPWFDNRPRGFGPSPAPSPQGWDHGYQYPWAEPSSSPRPPKPAEPSSPPSPSPSPWPFPSSFPRQ